MFVNNIPVRKLFTRRIVTFEVKIWWPKVNHAVFISDWRQVHSSLHIGELCGREGVEWPVRGWTGGRTGSVLAGVGLWCDVSILLSDSHWTIDDSWRSFISYWRYLSFGFYLRKINPLIYKLYKHLVFLLRSVCHSAFYIDSAIGKSLLKKVFYLEKQCCST